MFLLDHSWAVEIVVFYPVPVTSSMPQDILASLTLF